MFCRKCGKQIEDGSTFCPYCGEPVQRIVQNEQPQKEQSSSKGLIIGLVSAGAVLLAAVVLIFVFDVFHLSDKEEKIAEATTVTEEITTQEATTEAPTATKEIATQEATTEPEVSTPEEPEEAVYGEEHGYKFSELMTEDIYDTDAQLLHNDQSLYDINVDDYMKNYSCTSRTEKILVTEPDADGNVTYLVMHGSYHQMDLINDDFIVEETDDDPTTDFAYRWKVLSYVPDVSDYYTGEAIDGTYARQGEDTKPDEKIIKWNDKEYKISVIRSWVQFSHPDSGKVDSTVLSHNEYETYNFIAITVPQDYDGLVLSNPKKYTVYDGPEVDPDSQKILDIESYGYTGNAKDCTFIRVSDVATPMTDENEADMLSGRSCSRLPSFSWFVDKVNEGEDPTNIDIYNSYGGDITSSARIMGKWDCCIVWDPGNKLDAYSQERDFVKISSRDGITLTFSPKESYDSEGNYTDISDREAQSYTGLYNADGSVTFDIDGMSLTMDSFKCDGIRQYGFGTIVLQDGTEGKILLVRD